MGGKLIWIFVCILLIVGVYAGSSAFDNFNNANDGTAQNSCQEYVDGPKKTEILASELIAQAGFSHYTLYCNNPQSTLNYLGDLSENSLLDEIEDVENVCVLSELGSDTVLYGAIFKEPSIADANQILSFQRIFCTDKLPENCDDYTELPSIRGVIVGKVNTYNFFQTIAAFFSSLFSETQASLFIEEANTLYYSNNGNEQIQAFANADIKLRLSAEVLKQEYDGTFCKYVLQLAGEGIRCEKTTSGYSLQGPSGVKNKFWTAFTAQVRPKKSGNVASVDCFSCMYEGARKIYGTDTCDNSQGLFEGAQTSCDFTCYSCANGKLDEQTNQPLSCLTQESASGPCQAGWERYPSDVVCAECEICGPRGMEKSYDPQVCDALDPDVPVVCNEIITTCYDTCDGTTLVPVPIYTDATCESEELSETKPIGCSETYFTKATVSSSITPEPLHIGFIKKAEGNFQLSHNNVDGFTSDYTINGNPASIASNLAQDTDYVIRGGSNVIKASSSTAIQPAQVELRFDEETVYEVSSNGIIGNGQENKLTVELETPAFLRLGIEGGPVVDGWVADYEVTNDAGFTFLETYKGKDGYGLVQPGPYSITASSQTQAGRVLLQAHIVPQIMYGCFEGEVLPYILGEYESFEEAQAECGVKFTHVSLRSYITPSQPIEIKPNGPDGETSFFVGSDLFEDELLNPQFLVGGVEAELNEYIPVQESLTYVLTGSDSGYGLLSAIYKSGRPSVLVLEGYIDQNTPEKNIAVGLNTLGESRVKITAKGPGTLSPAGSNLVNTIEWNSQGSILTGYVLIPEYADDSSFVIASDSTGEITVTLEPVTDISYNCLSDYTVQVVQGTSGEYEKRREANEACVAPSIVTKTYYKCVNGELERRESENVVTGYSLKEPTCSAAVPPPDVEPSYISITAEYYSASFEYYDDTGQFYVSVDGIEVDSGQASGTGEVMGYVHSACVNKGGIINSQLSAGWYDDGTGSYGEWICVI